MVERKPKRGAAASAPESILPEKNEAVKVAIRCRPLNEKEQSQGHTKIVQINKARGEIIVQRPFQQEAPKQFTFDMTYGDDAE